MAVEHEGQRWTEPPTLAIGFALSSFSLVVVPSERAIWCQTACIFSGTTSSLQLDFTIGTEGEEKPTYFICYHLLQLFVNSNTDIVCKYTIHRVWPRTTDAGWHAVQFDCSWSEQHPLNCKTENASGSLTLQGNQGI